MFSLITQLRSSITYLSTYSPNLNEMKGFTIIDATYKNYNEKILKRGERETSYTPLLAPLLELPSGRLKAACKRTLSSPGAGPTLVSGKGASGSET